MVRRLVRHAPHIRTWELGNEPDAPAAFIGSPADYARWAALAMAGIRAAQRDARIVIGGFSHLNRQYIASVLRDRDHPLIDRFDIANIHLRGTLADVTASLARTRAFYRRSGFAGALWVTETGYPSEPAHQFEAGFQRGPRDQARWLARGLRVLVDDGADAVFVAFRDSPEAGAASPFASEGVLRWPVLTANGRARPKPAYRAVQRLAARTRRSG